MSDRVPCPRVRVGCPMVGTPFPQFAQPPQRGSVKVRFGTEIIRVGVQHMNVPWPTFCNNLRELTRSALQGVERGTNWKVTYTDDEGDNILVRSDPELQESFVAQKGPIKKYQLERSNNEVDDVLSIPPSPTELVAPPPPPPPSPSPVEVIAQIAAPLQAMFNSTMCAVPNKRLLSLLNSHQYTDAVRFFERHPNATDRTFLYNGACAYALSGNAKQACTTLERAVMSGYRDLQHLVSDTDLDSIRSTPEYVNVIQLITAFLDSNDQPNLQPATPVPTAPATEECTRVPPMQLPQPYPTAPATTVVTEEVPAVQTPEPAVEEFAYQSVLTTCIDMGLTDSPTLRTLIVKEDGDIAKVLDKLLATPR